MSRSGRVPEAVAAATPPSAEEGLAGGHSDVVDNVDDNAAGGRSEPCLPRGGGTERRSLLPALPCVRRSERSAVARTRRSG